MAYKYHVAGKPPLPSSPDARDGRGQQAGNFDADYGTFAREVSIAPPALDERRFDILAMSWTLATVSLFALLYYFTAVRAVDPVVQLDYATFKGTALSHGVTQWLGMRYAAPPTGDLRFAAPQDPPKIDGTQSATKVSMILPLPIGSLSGHTF